MPVGCAYAGCPSCWSSYGSNYYKLFTSKKEWSLAARDCQRYGANLVSVDSSGEQYFIESKCRVLHRRYNYILRGQKVCSNVKDIYLYCAGSKLCHKMKKDRSIWIPPDLNFIDLIGGNTAWTSRPDRNYEGAWAWYSGFSSWSYTMWHRGGHQTFIVNFIRCLCNRT